MKKCNFCLLDKEIEEFPKKGNRCKKCTADYKKEYAKRNIYKIKKQQKKWYEENSDKIKENVKKYEKENLENIKLYRKNYNDENYNDEYHREYRLKNKQKISEYKKEYYKNNKIRLNIKRKEYKNISNKNENLYLKLKYAVKGIIINSLKNGDVKKVKSFDEILGCNYEEFKLYLESKFTPEMNWGNYVTYWNLDHIVPISWAKTEQELYDLNNYTNFQPKYWLENKQKSNKYAG